MWGLQYLTPIRNAMRIFSAERGPRQIAGAIALGMLIGLMPKGTLLVVLFTVVMFSLRVNLGVGLSVAFLVSWVAPQLDPITHGFGVRAMQTPLVFGTIQRVYDWPLVPWTSLNNTVVLGSTLLGLTLVYPVYRLSERIIALCQPVARQWLNRRRQPKPASASLE